MIPTKLALCRKILVVTLAVVLANFTIHVPQVWAQNPVVDFFNRLRGLPPSGAPTGLVRGAAGRGRCPVSRIPLTAIVLLTNNQVEAFTVEGHPTFWFYVPYYFSEKLKSAEFVLLDGEKNIVFPKQKTEIRLPETPGIIKIRLPYKLETNKTYSWYFSIICDLQKPSRNPSVKGRIKRINSPGILMTQLNGIDQQKDEITKQRQKYLAYMENNIWYETLTHLAESRRNNPLERTFHDDWDTLFKEVDMPELAQEPIVNCCTLEEKEEK